MMKRLLLLAILLLPLTVLAQKSLTAVLQKMYSRYHGKWQKSLQFTQTTERYRNDSLIRSETWYETILYPNLLRIDIGKPQSGNGIIFRNDSTYVFRGGKVARAAKGENELIFFLGGLYSLTFEQVTAHFKDLNYDLNKFTTATWKGKPVFVIGAAQPDEKVNQLWIDRKKLVPVRYIKYENNHQQEGIFENHIALKSAWTETKATFYVDGKLAQAEIYSNCKADVPVEKSFFEPGNYSKAQ